MESLSTKAEACQSWVEGGSISKLPKKRGIPTIYSDIMRRSQGTGFGGDPRQVVSYSSVQPSVGSNTKNQGQYDRCGGRHRGDRPKSTQHTFCSSCGRNY